MKYFCGLKKRNYVSKQMLKLTLSNGEELYETHDIIKKVKTLYERLYSDRNRINYEILVPAYPCLGMGWQGRTGALLALAGAPGMWRQKPVTLCVVQW